MPLAQEIKHDREIRRSGRRFFFIKSRLNKSSPGEPFRIGNAKKLVYLPET